ncbi:MAG: Do family serine endopeptidase [Candidatus Pacebacteria bacterium]|nr:Do family serine endopeptidase [Candidatus Paceibacterota bacterium]
MRVFFSKHCLSLTQSLVLVAGLTLATVQLQAAAAPESFAPLVEKVRGAVVNISATGTAADEGQSIDIPQFPMGSPFEDFFKGVKPNTGKPRKSTSLGSGFIIDSSGIIITNNHVIDGGNDIKVTLQDGTILPATLVGRDPRTDLAVLRVKTERKLTSVEFGDSDKARVGDWVIAVGNPFALGGTVTAGIVSARGRDLKAGPYDDFLQIDAPINKGNSGGPTFNSDGQVIGVNTAILSNQGGGSIGIGFAIPSNIVKAVVAQLVKNGKMRRGWLGIVIQPISPELVEALKLPNDNGTLVASIQPKSPAVNSGIKEGDVIVRFNGKEVQSQHDLPRMVAATEIGSDATVRVIRDGKTMDFKVKIGELPDDTKQASKKSSNNEGTERSGLVLGMKLEGLTDLNRKQFNITNDIANGAVVVGVVADSKAAELGISAGDVILRVNDQSVKSPSEFREQVKKAMADGRAAVAVYLYSNGRQLIVGIPIDKKNDEIK